MAKMQVIFAVVTVLYLSDAYPLDAESTEVSQTSSHDLKVHPLLTGTTQQSNTETSNESDQTTEGTLIEETYIEVLLPGSPQLNASVLNSLLNASIPSTMPGSQSKRSAPNEESDATTEEGSSTIKPVLYAHQNRAKRNISFENLTLNNTSTALTNNTQEKQAVPAVLTHYPLNRSSRDTSAKQYGQGDANLSDYKKKQINNKSKSTIEDGQGNVNAKPVVPVLYSQQSHPIRSARDVSSEEDDSSSEENSSSIAKLTVAGSTVEPVLYAVPKSQNTKTSQESEENSSSSEDSSEEETTKQPASTRLHPALSSYEQQQNPNSRFARDIEEDSGSETTSSTEAVVYITPEVKQVPLN